MAINFKRFFGRESVKLKNDLARRLNAGRGFDNRPLRPKKWPNGRPLGYDKTPEGVPGRIRRAPVAVKNDGFTISLGYRLKDFIFNEGRGGQPARRYAGIPRDYFSGMVDRLVKFIEVEGEKEFRGRRNRF